MSSLPHESIPDESAQAPEAEPTVAVDEARAEVAGAIESIIHSAVNKAIKMDIGGIKDLAPSILVQKRLDELEIKSLSPNGRRLLAAIEALRSKGPYLSGGIRGDATNEDLVSFVDWLCGFNETWKSSIDSEDIVKNSDDLVSIVTRSGSGIQGRLSIGYQPLLSDEAKRELNRLFPNRDA